MSLASANLGTVLLFLSLTPAVADNCPPSLVKVPCRDMGDGRVLIDSLYLPDGYDFKTSRYTIERSRPTSMQGEWANRVCTIRVTGLRQADAQ